MPDITLVSDNSLSDNGDENYRTHWVANATDEQKLRAEAAIIAGAIIRSRGAMLSGPSAVKPLNVVLLAEWIMEGTVGLGDDDQGT